MKQIDLATGKETILLPEETVSCAIGNFDGVHLGHKALISLAAARQNTSKSAVWTFAEPSSRFLNGRPGLLSTMEERLSLFRELGIDIVFIEDFENVRDMEADIFAKEILYRRCHVRAAVCGFNFRYGKNAAGTAETLSEAFHALGASVTVMPPYQIGGVTVSSSEIRAALAAGDVETAAAMLGRPYSLTGEVVAGKKLGHLLGFPTANIPLKEDDPVRNGVYAARVRIDGTEHEAVVNVGHRPTVGNGPDRVLEAHLLDFEGDLYGQTIEVELLEFLREEQRFGSTEELSRQIEADKKRARERLRRDSDL